jgi:hypothetical protein
MEPAAGSEPAAGKVAYEMVELAGIEVASFQIATSLSRVELEKLGWVEMEETLTRTPPEARFWKNVSLKLFRVKYQALLTRDPARTVREEAVWPTVQWAAVSTVLAFSSEPPQKWEPLFCRETMKGKSPATAATPPTIPADSVANCGAARAIAGIARARSALTIVLTDGMGGREGGK